MKKTNKNKKKNFKKHLVVLALLSSNKCKRNNRYTPYLRFFVHKPVESACRAGQIIVEFGHRKM